MAKSQKKSNREAKKVKADQPKSKGPKYMEGLTTLSAPKVIIPDKRKK